MSGPPTRSRDGHVRFPVAQIIETVDVGGAESLAIQIANALAAEGWPSHLYVVTAEGELSARISPDVRVHYLRHWRCSITSPVAFARSVVRGFRILRDRVRADGVLLVQTHLPGANFWGLALDLAGVCRSIPTIHNNDEFSYGDRRGWRLALRRAAYRRMLGRCHALVAVSAEVRTSLLERLGVTDPVLGARVAVIPNGVIVPPPPTDVERHRVRGRHGLDPGMPLALGVGRLCEQKDFRTLVTAVGLLRDRGLRCAVIVAGEGPLRPELERQIAESGLVGWVRLPGNLTDLGDLMQAADLFVMPSRWEGLPLSLLEAMARGLPVVGSRIKGVAEVAAPGRSAVLVEPGDATGLADAMAELLLDPGRRRQLGRAGRDIVERRYDFRRVVEQVQDLYAAVTGSG